MNPYEAPRDDPQRRPPDFTDREASELADLRKRVEELERRVKRSWIVHPNFLLRIIGVWGYWAVGYAMIAAVVGAVMFVLAALGVGL